jgi:hypothetical protein
MRGRKAIQVAAAILGATLLLVLANWNTGLSINLEVESAVSAGVVAIYFDDGAGYRQETVVGHKLMRGVHRYDFPLPTARIKGFRIDPSSHDKSTRIVTVEARSGGILIKRFAGSAIIPVHDIAFSQIEAGGQGVTFAVTEGANDPYFVVSNSALDATPMNGTRFAAILFTVAFAVIALSAANGLARANEIDRLHAPGFKLGLTAGLVIAMAMVASTRYSVSPDEFNHFDAGRYYLEQWMPPTIGDPRTRESYSAYGASYLNELDIVYLIAAKFVVATSFLGVDDTIRFRLFNVSMLLLCAYLAFRSHVGRIVILPVLCTAQAWYLFGYFNADAFALAVAIVLGVSVATYVEAHPGATDSAPGVNIRAALMIGGLGALALLSKRTFYPFVVFIFGYALWQSGFRKRNAYALGMAGVFLLALWFYLRQPLEWLPAIMSIAPRALIGGVACALFAAGGWLMVRERHVVKRIPATFAIAAGLALVVVGIRLIVDIAINGWPWEKSVALTSLAEQLARADLRPSVLGTDAGTALATRGVGLWEILFGKYAWVSVASASFFGVYGYMSIYGPAWLYYAQYVLAIVLLCAAVMGCQKSDAGRGVVILGLSCMALALLLSILHSWVNDIQAQGRYVMAALPILGILLVEADRTDAAAGATSMETQVAHAAIAALWILAVVSFTLVGLSGIVRF